MITKHPSSGTAHSFASTVDTWLDSLSPQAHALWAKSGDETGSLSLPQHLGDTVCVAAHVFDFWVSNQMKARLSENLKLPEEQLRTLYIWLASLHDLGKATISFQTQIEQNPDFAHLVSQVAETGLPIRKSIQEVNLTKMPHGISSGVILAQWLVDFGMKRRTALWLTSAVDAHHGVASKHEERDAIESTLLEYPTAWREVHRELIDTLTELTGAQDALRALNASKVLLAADAQILAGLIVFADWIASNQDAFPMDTRGTQAERLERGIDATDLTQPWTPIAPPEDIDELYRASFRWPDSYNARSVQRAMAEVARGITHPSIIILEAETGVGKTEAALAAAHILGRQTGTQGVYFAAPTMATANGLLERTINWSQATATDGNVASLYLAHSKNQLSEPFQRLRIRGVAEDEAHGSHGEVVASSWMSGRRRGLLSNIAIGTIDQVLMLALEQRYSMLRHVALAGKIIIFDEVHAYDAYTSDYLETTLEWLAYYGATVILMSATLPPDRRRALIRAYSEQDLPETSIAYPLITVADENSTRYVTPALSPTNMVAPIELIDDGLDSLQALTEQLLTDGGCALIICNTIARAQAAYEQLAEAYGADVELHHAGFMAWQRSEREDALRAALGPHASRGNGRPYRKIVVATQVAEQSLDIDADVLITDIAPMDLIIQRAGRTHRHLRSETDRPVGLRVPKIYIRGVTHTPDGVEIDGGAQAIYDPKILLSTFIHLPDTFRRPDDIAELVRTTYAEHGDSIPPTLRPAWEEAVNKSLKRESDAHKRSKEFRIRSPRGLRTLDALFSKVGAAISLGDEEKGAAQVRDAEPSVEVIPIVRTEYGYRPFGTDKEILDGAELDYPTARHLASSTVRLPTRMTRYGSDFEDVVSDLEISTPGTWAKHFLLRGQLALVLNETGQRTTGRFTVQYSNSLGIEILSDKKRSDVGMAT
ncbi:CRISPR-associated helicase/endonuclease Cas3 [Corynebacterium sp. HMSC074A01]|uniref:CRISPR-associated helicase/endonuclease Cas3 n=1 Tax=Corynebacterium sp. HMSC074A01 TaxID=1715030 RepID=UPI0008A4EAA9|nr:CRISPR-associated helicase/endonuclease Cas3 [Corynebacterium sp. HMSC074A01]OHF35728.1 CRISPR-associated helicase/endonuclease Cas3 [Corynebacterium sp. HMSC074A01]